MNNVASTHPTTHIAKATVCTYKQTKRLKMIYSVDFIVKDLMKKGDNIQL